MGELLKPCPFCGKPAVTGEQAKPFKSGWIGCRGCHCYINWTQSGKAEAYRNWNERAGDNTKTLRLLMENDEGQQLCEIQAPAYMFGWKIRKFKWINGYEKN